MKHLYWTNLNLQLFHHWWTWIGIIGLTGPRKDRKTDGKRRSLWCFKMLPFNCICLNSDLLSLNNGLLYCIRCNRVTFISNLALNINFNMDYLLSKLLLSKFCFVFLNLSSQQFFLRLAVQPLCLHTNTPRLQCGKGMRWQMSLSGSRVSDHNTHTGDKTIDWCVGMWGFNQPPVWLERSLSFDLSSSSHLNRAFFPIKLIKTKSIFWSKPRQFRRKMMF